MSIFYLKVYSGELEHRMPRVEDFVCWILLFPFSFITKKPSSNSWPNVMYSETHSHILSNDNIDVVFLLFYEIETNLTRNNFVIWMTQNISLCIPMYVCMYGCTDGCNLSNLKSIYIFLCVCMHTCIYFLFVFQDSVSVCNLCCPGINSVDRAGLKFRDQRSPASASLWAGIKGICYHHHEDVYTFILKRMCTYKL